MRFPRRARSAGPRHRGSGTQEAESLTLLLISHELSLVYRYADQVLCLGRSRTFLGPPLEILTPERLQEVYGRPLRYHHHQNSSET